MSKRSLSACAMFLFACVGALGVFAQTLGEPENFTATAIVNNNLGSGAGTVLIRVTRWSTDKERTQLFGRHDSYTRFVGLRSAIRPSETRG